MLTGVVEVGLFCNIARVAYFGNEVPYFNSIHVEVEFSLTPLNRTVV